MVDDRVPGKRAAIIALVSFLTLCLQLLLTKILSFVFWNHVVYLVISIALLGYGVAATYVSVRRSQVPPRDPDRFLVANLLLFAAATVGGLAVLRLPALDAIRVLGRATVGQIGPLLLLLVAYSVFVLPFFFAGNVVVSLFNLHPRQANRLYFFDLFGAAAGCLAFPVVIRSVGALAGALLCATIAVGSALWYLGASGRAKETRPLFAASLVGLAVLGVLMVHPDRAFPLRVATGKTLEIALRDASARVEYTRWDPVTRMDVVAGRKDADLNLNWARIAPRDRLVAFDGDAVSHIEGRSREFPTAADLEIFRTGALATLVSPEALGGDHLIIGVGGAPDVASSLLLGADSVTAVEINASLVRALTTTYAEFAGRVPVRDNVRLVNSEARSFLERDRRKYRYIHMSGTDTFAALSTGAYTLAENYLYTKEALRTYYSHLSDDGCMFVLRWFCPVWPREDLRYFTTVLEALRDAGVPQPESHVVVAQMIGDGFSPCIILLYKRPLSPSDARLKLERMVRSSVVRPVYLPLPTSEWTRAFVDEAPIYAGFRDAFLAGQEKAFYRAYPFAVDPVVDDRPFFFNYYRLSTLLTLGSRAVAGTGPIQGYWAYLVFGVVLTCAVLAVAVFILLPLWHFKRRGLRAPASALALLYFASLGLGFIMLEVSLMQKLALFLGHPIYSITTVLATLLLSAGLGSAWSGRWRARPSRGVAWALLALVVVTGLFLALSGSLTAALLGWRLPLRVLVAIASVAPIGCSLGCFFPLGLLAVERRATPLVAWAWGINSGFTVIGSVAAIALAMVIGFSQVMLWALLIYGIGCLAFLLYERRSDRLTAVPTSVPVKAGLASRLAG